MLMLILNSGILFLRDHLKYILFLCLAFAFLSKSQAQSTSKKQGFIITQANDTLFGQVEAGKSTQTIRFRESSDQPKKDYHIDQVKAYKRNDGQLFMATALPLAEEETTTVFAQALVLGEASLFKYRYRFFISKNDTIVSVRNVEEEKHIDGQSIIKRKTEGIGALNYLLSDCLPMIEQNSSFEISEKAFTELIVAYNECVRNDYNEVKKEKAWSRTKFSLGSGAHFSRLSFNANEEKAAHLTESPFSSFSPILTSSIYLSSPRINEKLSLRIDLIYAFHQYNAYSLIPEAHINRWHDVSFSLHKLKLPLSIQYNFHHKLLSPYLFLGGSFGWLFTQDTHWIEETDINRVVETAERELNMTNFNQFGIQLGLGLDKNLFSQVSGFVELRLEVADNLVPATPVEQGRLRLNTLNFYCIAGIKF